MSVVYTHLTYENYKSVEEQMRRFAETSHRTEGGFYHKSIRLKLSEDLILEIHGPMVGGYGHLDKDNDEIIPVSVGTSELPIEVIRHGVTHDGNVLQPAPSLASYKDFV